MATFTELDEFFDDRLQLPIAGKTYTVPPASAETGLLCQKVMAAGIDAANGKTADLSELDDEQELDLYRRCLGPVHDELVSDGVSWQRIKHAGITAFLWIAGDTDTASRFWESGGHPEAQPAPANRTQRRAAAASTRKRGSTTGTNRTAEA